MKNTYTLSYKSLSFKKLLKTGLFCFAVLISITMKAQVTVSGSTGANGPYTSLKAAFDAINSNSNQTGNAITISITANTTELMPAVLNQPSAGSWTTLIISPSGGAAITVSGSLPFPLIALNGADNVTIDGLNTGGNSLTISNASTDNTGASTIVFAADATNNSIQNCTVKGSSTSATLATVGFSTGTVTGNDGNTITGCTITSAGSNLPFNAIGSAGTSASIDNSGISVINNNIQDYYNPGSSSNGIFVSAFSSAWTITGNKFFQTGARTATAGATHRAINIVTAAGGGYTISNNTIGYESSTGTGVTIYTGSFANRFLGIELTAAAIPVSTIQGNTIAAISLTTTSGATGAPGIFSGISVLGGSVTIGSTAGNTIGAATGTGSISITSSTSLGYIGGIYVNSTGTVSIQNNTIGSILTGGTGAIGYSFNGINTASIAGNFTISGNTIGSTSTANSITIGTNGTTTTGICKFRGINNAATGTISVTGNTIQNCSSYGTGSSTFNGILNTAGTGTLSISTNNILSGTNSGTGSFTGISNTAGAATLNINNNIIHSNTILSVSGAFTGIENAGGVTSAININDNQLGNSTAGLITYSAANSESLTGIANTNGNGAAQLTITGNNFQGITNSVASSSDHTYIINYTFAGSTTISSNTFTNLSVNTSGDVTFISNDETHDAGTTHTINNNAVVTGYTNTGAGGTVLFYNSYYFSPSTVTEINTGNNFSNLSFSGATDIYGWRSSDGLTSGSKKTVTNNIFRNITTGSGSIVILNVAYADNTYASNNVSGNIISNIVCGSDITGIVSSSGNQNFFSNTVDSLLSSGSGTVSGIKITGGTAQNVFKNKLYYLSNSDTLGGIDGIAISGGTTVNVYNNIIGDLRAVASNYPDAIYGINITSTSSNSGINLYYNTVYINATSSGTNFGTSGIFHATSTTATTASLSLRNNIIVNTSTPTGTGLTTAFRRSSGLINTLGNYSGSSNNNLFYAGTPGAANLIYSDGTSTAQTLAAYKAGVFTAGTIAPRDAGSITENPTFVSTSGPNPAFLHIDATVASQIESGAVNISTFTDDFDADIRQGNPGYAGTGTSPDIGADEFNGLPIDLTPPVITFTPLANNSCLTTDTLSATITDGTGININSGTKPRIWFKKTSNLNALPGTNTNTTDGWKYSEAINSLSPFSLPIDYSLVFGGVSAGDTIQYFVVAQDNATPSPNLSINSGTYAATQSSVALTSAAFPIGGIINSYKILSGLSGTVTVGTGGTYTTLTGAGGLFSAINTNGLAGNLTADILSNITETGTNPLNSIVYGCGSNYTLLIKPATGITATLSGSSTSALIKLHGADYVTIDGSNSGGTTRDLTISNTSSGTSSAVIWICSPSASDGATNNTVKNCIITGNSPTTTLFAIVSSSGTTIGDVAEAANANNTYLNNVINTCSYGIAVVGPSTGDSLTTISNNLIGSVTAGNKIGYRGLFISNQTNVAVLNNTIFGVSTSSTSTSSGIIVVGAISGGSINANKISDIKNTNSGGYGTNGIFLTAQSTASNLTVSNNMIYDIAGYGWSSSGSGDNGYGIIIGNGGGYKVYYNTVSMNTNQTDVSGVPAAFNVTSGVTTPNSLDVRNNIFSNSQTLGTQNYSIICNAANTVFTDINYNDYHSVSGPNLGYSGSDIANLAAWQTATGKDVNSLSVAPVFTSATDLHLVIGSNCGIDHRGIPITGLTVDIDTDTRDVSNPDMGADEFYNPDPILSSTLTPTAICSGNPFVYTASSTTSGVTFTWSRATISGITQAGTTGTANVNETLTNTTGAPINVTYVYTTTATICSNIENVIVSVNPSPALSSSLTPPTVCSGTTFSYTATSGSSSPSFTWTRATVSGINEPGSSGVGNVNEILTNSTLNPITVTYVYTTTATGCPGTTQNVLVVVSPVPALSSSLAPSTCSGTLFSYTATSTTPGVSYTWSRATTGGISEPGTSGTANINELLTNTTSSAITVTYVYSTNANGCVGSTQNVVVTVHPLPTVSLATLTSPVCLQVPAFALTGGTPAGGTFAGGGVSGGMFNPSVAGVGSHSITYSVTANGCTNATSQSITVESCTGIDENLFSNFRLYPNPSSGKFNIVVSNANFNELLIRIIDIQGKEVYSELDKNSSSDYSKQINLIDGMNNTGLAKGVYYIKLITDANVEIQKLIIE